ncbi:MAG: carboxypeptidase-like regulatory domain-containing protein [Bacteroides sp.]|nr:carboxypeptidase-like regulatory domain-containing protein [Bacteroides sp.]
MKGKIVDTGKEEIIGANVLIKGTTIGTITDFDGNFTLTADVGSVLVVAYLGYLPTEVEVKGTAPMLIELTENSKELDELVVGIRYPEENYQYRFPIGDQSNF